MALGASSITLISNDCICPDCSYRHCEWSASGKIKPTSYTHACSCRDAGLDHVERLCYCTVSFWRRHNNSSKEYVPACIKYSCCRYSSYIRSGVSERQPYCPCRLWHTNITSLSRLLRLDHCT